MRKESGEVGSALNKVVREGFSDRGKFEQKPEEVRRER